MSRTGILGLSSGIVFVVATLIAVALLNLPHSAGAAVASGRLSACPLAEVALDQGYGVSRTMLQPVCPVEASQMVAAENAAR